MRSVDKRGFLSDESKLEKAEAKGGDDVRYQICDSLYAVPVCLTHFLVYRGLLMSFNAVENLKQLYN